MQLNLSVFHSHLIPCKTDIRLVNIIMYVYESHIERKKNRNQTYFPYLNLYTWLTLM